MASAVTYAALGDRDVENQQHSPAPATTTACCHGQRLLCLWWIPFAAALQTLFFVAAILFPALLLSQHMLPWSGRFALGVCLAAHIILCAVALLGFLLLALYHVYTSHRAANVNKRRSDPLLASPSPSPSSCPARHPRCLTGLNAVCLLLLLLLLAADIYLMVTFFAENPALRDVAYGPLSAHKLDLFLPSTALFSSSLAVQSLSTPFPLIIHIHGGAFAFGDKTFLSSMAYFPSYVTSRGYAVASLDYRLSGEAQFPSQIYDIKAAVRYLRAHADSFNLDTNHFTAWGESAGGNLVTVLGTSWNHTAEPIIDMPSMTSHGDQSARVHAVVDWYGPIDFSTMDAQLDVWPACAQSERHNTSVSPEAKYIGAPLWAAPDRWAATNPLRYVTAETAPVFFIQHGTADCTVPVQQSQQFHAALVDLIGAEKAQLRLLEGEGHATPVLDAKENVAMVLDWLDGWMK